MSLNVVKMVGSSRHETLFNIPFTEGKLYDIRQLSGNMIYIQADGDELEHIINRFPNLPHSYRICRWRGDLARLIADNLTV